MATFKSGPDNQPETLDFTTIAKLETAPVYKTGTQMHSNTRDDAEPDRLREAFDYIAARANTTFGPGPRRTMTVSLYEGPDGLELSAYNAGL